MTEFENGKRSRNLFDPTSEKPFKLSRSKLELFFECPRCFYLDRRLGVGRPSGPGFTLNMAVDELLKKEFDQYRAAQKPHPIMTKYGVDAVPYQHEMMDKWRHNFTGVQAELPDLKLIIFGAVDDIWVNPAGELIVVDYKATSTTSEINLQAQYRQGYKRQMEIYQWLLRQNGFKVHRRGYFVYANGLKNRDAFEDQLTFETILLSYDGDDSWVLGMIQKASQCMASAELPDVVPSCEYCAYRHHSADAEHQP
jgi:hypothetical protein